MRSSPLGLVTCLAVLLALSPGGQLPARSGAAEVEAAYRELVLALEGDPAAVRPSPALCASDPRPASRDAAMFKRWHYGVGDCGRTWQPHPKALITPISEGGAQRYAESATARARLDKALEQLYELAVAAPLSPQIRLRVHSTAWEVAFGLDRSAERNPERREAIEPTRRKALKLLAETVL